jgi:type I restriction enzyme S subunit
MENNLPKGWVETQMGSILKLKNGFAFKSSSYSDQGYPLIRISNIKSEKIVINENNCIPEDLYDEKFLVNRGDILIAMSGATTGKYGIYDHDIKALQNQRVGNFVPYSDKINKRFIYFLIGVKKKEIEDQAYGGAQPNISSTLIENLKIPLPPRAVQDRIVAKVDALMAQHAAIQQAMKRIPQLLKDFRQQVLTQAVTGKLTEEWRVGKELEDGISQFKRLHSERISNLRNGEKPNFLRYKVEDVEVSAIESWYVAPVGLTNDCIVPGRDKPKSFTGNIPWITTPDLKDDFISISKQGIGLTNEEISEVNAKIIPKDSVIISIVGRFGVSSMLKKESVINQQLHAFLPSQLIEPKYLMYYFKTLEKEMNNLSSSTTIAYINKTKANSLKVNVPSLQEQQEIVRRVESLFEKAAAIEQCYEQLKTQIDSLPQSILHKAFKGDLVEQLDSDGSAMQLLEEIEGLKAKSKSKGKTKGKQR